MSALDFRPIYREDGSLDPQCLEDAGRHWIRGWLERRFSGSDPYFPIDRRGDEDPEALVVHILQQAGSSHPLTISVSEVLLALLDEARKAAPDVPVSFSPVLNVCQLVRLPATSSWFTEELAALARSPESAESRWGQFEVTKEIVYAAAVQCPGLPRAASYPSWLSLLYVPRYATLALLGLGQTFEQTLPFLETWWRTCVPEERQRELDHLFFMALKDRGEPTVHSLLAATSAGWPHVLEDAVNSALLRSGGSKAFLESSPLGIAGFGTEKTRIYPKVRITLRSRNRYALVSAIRQALRRSGMAPLEIETFSREALTTRDPQRFEELWRRAVENAPPDLGEKTAKGN